MSAVHTTGAPCTSTAEGGATAWGSCEYFRRGPRPANLQSPLYIVAASLVLITVYQPRPRASPIPLATPLRSQRAQGHATGQGPHSRSYREIVPIINASGLGPCYGPRAELRAKGHVSGQRPCFCLTLVRASACKGGLGHQAESGQGPYIYKRILARRGCQTKFGFGPHGVLALSATRF